jgi:hypothetical protein
MYVCGVHAVSGVKSLIPPCNIFNLSLNELLSVVCSGGDVSGDDLGQQAGRLH